MRSLALSLACVLGSALAAAACVRDPLDRLCPDHAPGDLVVTEIRGPQTGADSYGQWIELYNATDRPIDLAGVSLTLRRLDGSGDFRFMVRDPEARVEPRAYAVLGGARAEDKPFVTYDFTDDASGNFYAAALLDLYTCEARVDAMLYRALPSVGTLSLDGAREPDAAANDDADVGWCTDDAPPAPGEPITELGVRGTPGEANRPCP